MNTFDKLTNILVSFGVLSLTSTYLPTRRTLAGRAGLTPGLDVSLRRLRSACSSCSAGSEERRRLQIGQHHGGIAVVESAAVRLTKLYAPSEPATFELHITRMTVAGSFFVFAVVYRPGSDSVTAALFDILLEHL